MGPQQAPFFVGSIQKIATLAPYFDKPGELVIFPALQTLEDLGSPSLFIS